MTRGIGTLLIVCAALCADGLDGEITGGKAKKLVQQARPYIEKANALYKTWWEKKIPEEELDEKLKQGVSLFDKAATLLADALEIKFDPSVNNQLRIVATRLQRMEFSRLWREQRRKRLEAERRRAKEEPDEKPEESDTPKPAEADEVPAQDPGRRLPERDNTPPPAPEFAAKAAPGVPRDVKLPVPRIDRASKAYQKRLRADKKAIYETLKEQLQSRKQNKLLTRHILCAGTGTRVEGETCAECGGTGQQINLFHFRKIFWNPYTPMLRDSTGALDALKAFHTHAQKNLGALGPVLKAFEIPRDQIDHHDFWARVLVRETSKAGTNEYQVTMVSIGSSWYVYTDATDRELIPNAER